MLRRIATVFFVASVVALAALPVGAPLPEFQIHVQTPAHQMISAADLKGKVVLVEAWASYCDVCRAQFPILRQLDRDYRDRGLQIVGISMDTDTAAFENALRNENP